MKNIINPVVVATAFFTAYLLMDLFTNNYKYLPQRALVALVCILAISVLCKNNMYGFAWLVLATPALFIIGSIMIRDYNNAVSASKTLQPTAAPKERYNPAPYYL